MYFIGGNAGYDYLVLVLSVIIIALVGYVVYLVRERRLIEREIELRANERFMQMKEQLVKEALDRSRATLKGKIAEQIVPFLAEFKYNPSDARFIGSPIDYIIFDGYTDVMGNKVDKPITIVLADIKTGRSATLTPMERRIKEALEQKRVKWETIHIEWSER